MKIGTYLLYLGKVSQLDESYAPFGYCKGLVTESKKAVNVKDS